MEVPSIDEVSTVNPSWWRVQPWAWKATFTLLCCRTLGSSPAAYMADIKWMWLLWCTQANESDNIFVVSRVYKWQSILQYSTQVVILKRYRITSKAIQGNYYYSRKLSYTKYIELLNVIGNNLLLTTSMSWDRRSPILTVRRSLLLPTGRIRRL